VTGPTVLQLSKVRAPLPPPADTGEPESLTPLLWIAHWVLCISSSPRYYILVLKSSKDPHNIVFDYFVTIKKNICDTFLMIK
jgi:hypothetical protein